MSDHQPATRPNASERARRRRIVPWLLGILVMVLLCVLVALEAFGVWEVVPLTTASDTLLLYALSSLNFAAFLVFTLIFVRSLLTLRKERRERGLGSKIKVRLIKYFIGLSLLPITAMAVFSYLYFNRTLEKWFSRLPESVVSEASRVQDEASSRDAENLRQTATMLAALFYDNEELADQQTFDLLVTSGQLSAIEIVSPGGEVLVRSEGMIRPDERYELDQLLAQARTAGHSGVNLADGKGFDAAIAPMEDGRSLILVPARRSDSNLAQAITSLGSRQSRLIAKQRKVRLLGLSTLGLFTLLQLFGVTWIALHLAREIATPIRALAEASDEIARGNLSHRVKTVANDELALLADSFNQMTEQLQENRQSIERGAAELREKNNALEERRTYIETVLESLSTGVISVDANDRITTINAAAIRMLRLPDKPHPRCMLAEITGADDQPILDRILRRARRVGTATEQTELLRGPEHEGETITVALTATALKTREEGASGAVLVMEDLSELLTAQRAAAWSEVAQRMAHEIKNPLTPIQLSAERISRSFHRQMDREHSQTGHTPNGSGKDISPVPAIVDECTETIAREVAALKGMVDEFSRFARLPHAQLELVDLNEVVEQSISLYEERLDGVRLETLLAPSLPLGKLDSQQMRRVFVNLIDNALEALAGREGDRRITIATGYDSPRACLLAEVTDNGHGIARSDLGRLFHPYFSTRGRGTGLGLAIVYRIVTEHGGRIRAESNNRYGSRFIIELPASNIQQN